VELRTVLYGYNKYQFQFLINKEEAIIVRRIYDEYISGKTLLQIANALTAESVVYYRDRTTWSKQAVRRVIENSHYAGDKEYPAIVEKGVYKKANKLRLEKGGDREKDTPEIRYLKYHTKCAQCGGRITRKAHYSGKREAWHCVNGCKTSRYLDDKAFLSDILSIINCVLDNPNILLRPHSEEEQYRPSIKVQRDERTLNDLMQRDNMTFVSAKKMYFDVLADQFDLCKIDRSYAVTDALVEYVAECEPIDDVSTDLFRVIVAEILVDDAGRVSIKFANDAVIKTDERGVDDERTC